MKSRYQIVDGGTAFHFAVGSVAGYAGMDPKLVLLAALAADASWEILKASRVSAAFEPGHSQSKAKEIMDLLSIIFGAHLGKLAKELSEKQAAAAPVAPSPAAPAASGFGIVQRYPW